MIRFQADADLDFRIVLGVRQREPSVDFAAAKERAKPDPEVLERAASEGRILVTHDRGTMLEFFKRRLQAGNESPGLFLVPQRAPLGPVVEAIILVWAASEATEWRNQIHHLPSFSRHVFAQER